jgi:hypothetical protein
MAIIVRLMSRRVLNIPRLDRRVRLRVISALGGAARAGSHLSTDADEGAACLRWPISGIGCRGGVGCSKRCPSRFKM